MDILNKIAKPTTEHWNITVMFTREHYESIAKIIGCTLLSNKWSSDDVRIQMFLYVLSDYFQEDNPKFDDNKFLKICGFES